MILSEDGKILLILPNLQQTKHKPIQKTSRGEDYFPQPKNSDESNQLLKNTKIETDAGEDKPREDKSSEDKSSQ